MVGNASNDSMHTILVRIACWLDHLFTRDDIFDVRVLGFIYTILFLPAIYLIIYTAVERVKGLTERIVIIVLGVLIFSDISYLVYFNSIYTEALIYICLLYILGGAMSLQKQSKYFVEVILILTFATTILCFTRSHCYMIGIVMGALCFSQIRIKKERMQKLECVVLSFLLVFVSIGGKTMLQKDFTDTDKFHAMTRGVLLQSSDPVKTLSIFGINDSYSMLTDVSLFEQYPMVKVEERNIQHGFLDQYTKEEILLYYMSHPGTVVGMLDLAIKASCQRTRSYCGNYEKSAGHKEMAKSIFMSLYSNFKVRSMPQTFGYVVVLIACYFFMSLRRIKVNGKIVPSYYVYLTVMLAITGAGILHILSVMIQAGDATLDQYVFILSFTIDFLNFFVLTELLEKINIFDKRGEVNATSASSRLQSDIKTTKT